MVVSGWVIIRGFVASLVAVAALLLSAGPALAQESTSPAPPAQTETADPDKTTDGEDKSDSHSTLETIAGGATCFTPGGAFSGALSGLVNALPGDFDIPTCQDVAGGIGKAGLDAVGDAAERVAEGAAEKAALSFGNAGAEILKFALGWWITTDSLDGDVFRRTVSKITDYTFYIQVAAFSLSMILLGARLAMARSGSIRDTSEEGFRQMARATLVAGAFTMLVILGTQLSDGIANWFMDGTVGSDPTGLVEAMVMVSLYAGPAGMALLFVIGLLGILGGLVMAFLMLMRTGFLVLMAAALPIAGAAGGTKVGSQAFDKMISWTIAWLLVKPVGAFVIGCSAMLFIEAADPRTGDAMMALTGVILLCAAALVLPALMRMIVPNVGALGGGGSGAAAGAAVGALAMKGAGMMAGGGAPTGAAAASSSSTTASTSTSSDSAPTTGAPQPTPASFGNGGGDQQPGGNGGGTPGGGEPGGSDPGTPPGRGGSDGGTRPDMSGVGAVTTGADPKFNSGGFEK